MHQQCGTMSMNAKNEIEVLSNRMGGAGWKASV